MAYNGYSGVDTTNLGWNNVASQGSNVVASGPHITTTPMWQAMAAPAIYGSAGQAMGALGGGSSGGSNLSSAGANPMASAMAAQTASSAQIQSLISQQMAQNNSARAQNQQNWNSASQYMQGLGSKFASDPATVGSEAVTQNIMNNPDVLSAGVQQQIMNKAQNQIGAQAQAGLNSQYGMMQAVGQGDSSSMAAAKAASDRASMAALGNSASNLGVQAATANRASETSASQLGQAQANTDINPFLTIGNSVLSHLPQVKPDDYSGLMALTNQMGNQQFQDALLMNQQQTQQANQQAALTRPQNPSATRLLGPNDNNQSRTGGGLGNGGFTNSNGSLNNLGIMMTGNDD